MPEVLALKETDVMPITAECSLQEQAKDSFCKQVAEPAGQPESQYDHDRHGFLVQKHAPDGIL